MTAEDIDSGVNAELTYSIAGGNPYGLFQVGCILVPSPWRRRLSAATMGCTA